MKKSIITSLTVVLGLAIPASAALYTATNNVNGVSATPIVSSIGRQVSGSPGNVTGGSGAAAYSTVQGIAAIGYFDFGIADDGITQDSDLGSVSKASILGAFVQYGAAGLFTVTNSPVFTRGLFTAPTTGTVGTSSFNNKNIYILVGSGASTLAGSTEFLILKSSTLFTTAQDDILTPALVNVSATQAGQIPTLLLGEYNNFQTRHSVADNSTTAAWNTVVPVPEPSSAALGLFAGLGLLARRRRA